MDRFQKSHMKRTALLSWKTAVVILIALSFDFFSLNAQIISYGFEDTPLGQSVGFSTTLSQTNSFSLQHSGSFFAFNNGNSAKSIDFVEPVDFESAWLIPWAGFPAISVNISGLLEGQEIGVFDVNFVGGWEQITFPSTFNNIDKLIFTPRTATTANFGTFGIDDITFSGAAPEANDDATSVNEGGTVTILDGGATSLLANDTAADINNLSVSTTPVSGPSHGTLTLTAGGTFTYIHDGSETTTDSFIYEISDGAATDAATVLITIIPVNDPPIAVDDAGTVLEGGTVSVLASGATSVLANDTDAENDTLTVNSTPVSGPSYGTLSLAADGEFTYSHNGTETITDSFVYELSDGSNTATETVFITIIPVSDVPPVVAGENATAVEGGSISAAAGGVTSLLANDSTNEPNETLVVITTGVIATTNGSVTLNADGTFTYTHDGSETTSDFFDYTVGDSAGGSAGARVNISITPVDDPAAITRKLYSVDRNSNLLRVIDPSDGSTLESITMTLVGKTINGATGLVRHPTTGQLWALLKLSFSTGRDLVTIDPTTGVVTRIGDTRRFFAALAFDGRGILYGLTGDGGSPSETVFILDQNDASSTLFMALGNGSDGEAIAFNPDDGLFYHASGFFETFESIDFFTKTVADIGPTGDDYEEATGMTYESPGNILLAKRASDELYRVGVDGVSTFLGPTDHRSKGLAFNSVATSRIQDNLTAQPFLGLKIEDVDNPALALSVTITLDDPAKGVLTTLGGFSDDGGGVYSFSGTAVEATAAIQGLIFDPTEGRVAKGNTESTVFTIEVDDGTAAPVSDTRTVVSTAVENSPVFTNAPIPQTGSSSPYASETVTFDVNPADPLVITSTTLPGWLTLTDNGDGTASLTGTPTSEDLGANTVSLTVTNTVTGNSTTQVSTVTVVFTNHRPNIRNNLNLYAVSKSNDQLRIIDPANGSTLRSVTIDIPGELIRHVNGLATHPFTGELWAVVEVSGFIDRDLYIIDPSNGATTHIGNLGDNYAGLAFDENGTLFGVTGDGGSPGEEFYILDQSDASETFFMDLGNGSSGETIGFNPDEGLMYHGSGSTFEIIDLDRKIIIPVSSSFSAHSALTYEGSGNFLLAVYSSFYRVSTSGVRTVLGSSQSSLKGLAFTGIEGIGLEVTDITSIKPFLKVTIGDIDILPQNLTVMVSLDDPGKGSLETLGGFIDQGGGVYSFTGTAAAATSAIRGLTFVPTENRVGAGLTETTTFTISVDDGIAPTFALSTKVTSTSVNDNPIIRRDPALYSGDRSKNILRVIDPADGSTIKAIDVVVNVRTETFDVDSGALGVAKGVNIDGFNFGWNNDNSAGGVSPGELGGTFARGNDASTHYFADTNIGAVTRLDSIHIRGNFIITANNNANLRIQVGFINTTTADLTPLSSFQNQLGMAILEPSFNSTDFRVISHSNTTTGGDQASPSQDIPVGSKTTFNFLYRPSGMGDGNGTAFLTLKLEDGTLLSSTVKELRNPDTADIDFNAFVIGSAPASNANATQTADVFFDDISYTVAAGTMDTVKKIDALATHPLTGELWAVTTLTLNLDERRLVILDPPTGVATLIGNTGTKITGLAFDNAGGLFGVTGSGSTPPESLFTISQTDGTPTLFMNLGNGGSGETIGFNPDDGLMYHGSGEVFEAVDLSSLTVNPISSSFSNVTALTFEGNGNFFLAQFSEFSRLSVNGTQSILGTMDHDSKGFAFNEYDGSGQSIGDFESIAPFQLVTIGHTGNPPADVTVTVTLDDSAKGLLSNLGGFSIIGGGSYSFDGSPDAATTAIQGLVFQPEAKRVALGTTETTLFTIVADDGLVTPVTDTTTSVVTTAVLESYDDWVVRVFSGSDAGDPNKSGQLVDFNGDGVANLLVYTFGLDPALNNVGELPFSTLSDTGDAVCLFFRLAENAFLDVTITVESSTDLTVWNTVNETPELFSDEGDYEIIKVTVPVNTDEKLFLRLVVEEVTMASP